MKLVLGSQSPRRKELLGQIVTEFTIDPANNEEVVIKADHYAQVLHIAQAKMRDVFPRHRNDVVLCADTIVVLGERIYNKPQTPANAKLMLAELAGQTHTVLTAVVIKAKELEISFIESSQVTFKELTEAEIEEYVATGEPFDKSGGYAIQGKFKPHIAGFSGEKNNIIGLPTARTREFLKYFCPELVKPAS